MCATVRGFRFERAILLAKRGSESCPGLRVATIHRDEHAAFHFRIGVPSEIAERSRESETSEPVPSIERDRLAIACLRFLQAAFATQQVCEIRAKLRSWTSKSPRRCSHVFPAHPSASMPNPTSDQRGCHVTTPATIAG